MLFVLINNFKLVGFMVKMLFTNIHQNCSNIKRDSGLLRCSQEKKNWSPIAVFVMWSNIKQIEICVFSILKYIQKRTCFFLINQLQIINFINCINCSSIMFILIFNLIKQCQPLLLLNFPLYFLSSSFFYDMKSCQSLLFD